jgi:hypothetical protein
MKRTILLSLAALITGAAIPAQSILDSIRTPDKAVATVNQTLTGTWLAELHRPVAPATASDSKLITFQPDGTAVASTADGTQATNHGYGYVSATASFCKPCTSLAST